MELKQNNLVEGVLLAFNKHVKSLPVLVSSIFLLITSGKVIMLLVVNVTEAYIVPLSLSFVLALLTPNMLIKLEEIIRTQSIKNDEKNISEYLDKTIMQNSYLEEDIQQTKNPEIQKQINNKKDHKLQSDIQSGINHQQRIKKDIDENQKKSEDKTQGPGI